MPSQIEELALFPLSDVVLFPQVSVPLFVFEPRYRQMTRDVLEGSRQIGMATVRPDSVGAMQGDPPIFAVGCAGRVAQSQERPDGTFQILLLGERRFRIQEEHPRRGERLYRTACVELLEDPEPDDAASHSRLDACRARVLDGLTRLISRVRDEAMVEEQLSGFSALEPTHLVNALSQSISFDPIERQQLLEADSILARFEIMEDLLRFRLAEGDAIEAGTRSLPN
jgi:Lon protease-like protein